VARRPTTISCASCEGHLLSVLTVIYPGGRTRQFSLRREMVPVVRRCLANYQRLRKAICELNHDLPRADESGSRPRRKRVIEILRAQLASAMAPPVDRSRPVAYHP
jgi:hypothetical protein